MSSSVPQILRSDVVVLIRRGEAALQARSSKRRGQGLKATAQSSVEHTSPYEPLDTHQVSVDASQLCKKCRNYDLGKFLDSKRIDTDSSQLCMGPLEEFNNPHCQLCDTIRHYVKLHWGSQWPSATNGCQPTVFMQGNHWCSFSDSGSQHIVCRITLAVDQQPPQFKQMRRALKSEVHQKFVLTELEVDPLRLKNTSSVPSLRRPIPACVDLKVVRGWLQGCRNHGACNDNRISQNSNMVKLFASGFRLIDVMEGKLVEKTEPCEYIALSYVWGQLEPSPLRTNKKNLSALHEPSSLYPVKRGQRNPEQISRTIEDAIVLCRSIGQRYLWVDSICIVQDDQDEKRRLIHGMDRVYENASLTIVALSGSDAAAGLAGITPRGRDIDNDGRQHLFHKGQGTHCIGIGRISLEEHIRSSHWNTRGWTYQEQLLSPRKMYFSSNEVFYECERGIKREGYGSEGKTILTIRKGAPWFGTSGVRNPTDVNPLYSTLPRSWDMRSHDKGFRDIVSIYTRKSLTEPGDVLNALTGIYHKFYNSAAIKGPGIHGLQGNPKQFFFRSLLWFTPGGHHERRSIVNGFRPSSWSWTSFDAPVDFATAPDASFPASVEASHSTGTYCLVKKFFLYFQTGESVDNIQISTPQRFLLSVPSSRRPLTSPEKLLDLFSARDHEALPALSSVSPGVLEFLGPYIPTPTAASSRWSETAEGEWQLSFEGQSINGFGTADGTVLVVKLDPGEDTTDGFVLLSWDCTYLGICVKKRGEYFERVGLVILTGYLDDWQTIAGEGLLELYWKHILLR